MADSNVLHCYAAIPTENHFATLFIFLYLIFYGFCTPVQMLSELSLEMKLYRIVFYRKHNSICVYK